MSNVTLTNITPPRVPLTDERTGLISREWYRFFLNLFKLTGGGQNTTSLTDLQVRPPIPTQEDLTNIIVNIAGLLIQPVSGTSEVQAALDIVRQELQTLPPNAINELQQQVNILRQEVETQRQPELGSMAPLDQDNVPWLTFNNAPLPVSTAVGTIAWDGGTTLGVQMTTNVLGRVCESLFVYVKASAAITKGQVIVEDGSVGASGVLKAKPAPLGTTNAAAIIGIAAESLALNAFGLVQIHGYLSGLNTTGSAVGETWTDGDILYYNPAYVGGLTNVKPVAPNIKLPMCQVINAGSGASGSVLVAPGQSSVLGGTDSNVQFGTLNNGDLIQYDSTAGYWKNVSASSVIAGTATAPVTKTVNFTVAAGEKWIINNKSGSSCTVILPAAASNIGRELYFLNHQPQTLVSASSNVIPLAGGSAATAILEAVAGANTTLVSDGTNWIMTQYDSNNALQLE